ncbi:MAG: hypothetical protein ACYDCH_10400 [Gaiellaceae bacterium]
MPRLSKLRPGPLAVAIAAWDVWRRLTPKQRKLALDLARKHGPKVAKRAVELRRATRRR